MSKGHGVIGLVVITVVLGACATDTVTPVEGAESSGSPAPTAGYDWFLNEQAGETRLAFGQADSDDVALVLACTPGAGQIELSQLADTKASDIHLESGGETERFPAVAEPSQIHDGSILTASAHIDVPIFQRFRRVGWVAVWHGDRRETLTPQPASIGRIERFFSLCG